MFTIIRLTSFCEVPTNTVDEMPPAGTPAAEDKSGMLAIRHELLQHRKPLLSFRYALHLCQAKRKE